MKKALLVSLMAALLAVSPAYAHDDRYYSSQHGRGDYHDHRDRRDDRRKNEWILPLVGGIILGAVINESTRYRPKTQVCENFYLRDRYGNFILDYRDRPVIEQRCWYQ